MKRLRQTKKNTVKENKIRGYSARRREVLVLEIKLRTANKTQKKENKMNSISMLSFCFREVELSSS